MVGVPIVTDTEPEKLPPLGVIVGVPTVETVVGAVILNVKLVLLVMPPAVALIVTKKFPVGVDPLVVILRTVEQEGVQDAEENDAEAPEGSPETLKDVA